MAGRQLAWQRRAQGLGERRPQADHSPPVSPLSTHPPYLVLQDEVTSLVQWMVVQICLGRKHKQLWQQGIQEKCDHCDHDQSRRGDKLEDNMKTISNGEKPRAKTL